MVIRVLGTGCAKCKVLYETTWQAVAELGIDAVVIKEEDLIKIMDYNVIAMPGLVINEKVVSSGKNLSLSDVKNLLTQ